MCTWQSTGVSWAWVFPVPWFPHTMISHTQTHTVALCIINQSINQSVNGFFPAPLKLWSYGAIQIRLLSSSLLLLLLLKPKRNQFWNATVAAEVAVLFSRLSWQAVSHRAHINLSHHSRTVSMDSQPDGFFLRNTMFVFCFFFTTLCLLFYPADWAGQPSVYKHT